jgi:hypothetical protein
MYKRVTTSRIQRRQDHHFITASALTNTLPNTTNSPIPLSTITMMPTWTSLLLAVALPLGAMAAPAAELEAKAVSFNTTGIGSGFEINAFSAQMDLWNGNGRPDGVCYGLNTKSLWVRSLNKDRGCRFGKLALRLLFKEKELTMHRRARFQRGWVVRSWLQEFIFATIIFIVLTEILRDHVEYRSPTPSLIRCAAGVTRE